MPLSGPSRRDSDAAGRGDPDAADRLRSVRDRLEAIVLGLRELEYLRERQEAVVRAALEKEEPRMLAHRSSEENILVLRKQLSCLRRKDAALITQLQELDQQISDLRLDAEVSHDLLEMDSRPSSGFYELSDGTSGSLSNSSHSVFSECFCPAADADGHFLSTDELVSCLDSGVLVGGLCDDLSPFAAVRRSLSAPPPPPMDAASLVVSDFQYKSPFDPLSRNIYCYLGPLCALAIQSSAFLQTFSSGVGGRDKAVTESLKPEPTIPSDPVSDLQNFSSFQKNMDSYIKNLLQRRAQPIRTNRPRTSISTDPSKSLQQQADPCVRQAFRHSSGFRTRGSEVKLCRPAEEQDADMIKTGLNLHCSGSPGTYRTFVSNRDDYRTVNGLTRKRSAHSAGSVAARPKDLQEHGPPTRHFSPKDASCCTPHQELLFKSLPSVRTLPDSPKNQSNPVQSGPAERGERLSLIGGGKGAERRRSSRNGPSKQNIAKLRGGSNKNIRNSTKPVLVSENNELLLDRRWEKNHHRPSSRKLQVLEGGASSRIKVSKRGKCVPASVLECQLPDRKTTATLGTVQSGVFRQHHQSNHHHHHGRVVVARPKSKRSDYLRSHSIMEVPSDRAARRALCRQRKEVLSSSGSNIHPPSRRQRGGYGAGSDSEYSAECVSLFHSTIVETSEDEKSNYTTNCFGDGESSEEEETEESSTPSSTEESVRAGTGGRGRRWRLAGYTGVRVGRQDTSLAQSKACVKVKASYKLKKKILRFRSGSLKLMTTV